MPRRTIAPPNEPLVQLGAAELARRIARREVSSVEVLEAHRQRIEAVHGQINAIVVTRWDEARHEAEEADRAVAAHQPLGPLHGVPLTIKECFHLPGTSSTVGLTTRVGLIDQDESPLVTRLRKAGAIILGKTNVPQLMCWHECANPVYGCTNSPWDLDRSPGGSTGGEAAAIAAYCSPLGLGSDLGGSIRVPAAAAGLFGLKPTSYRVTNQGTTGTFRGQIAMTSQPGPLARTAEDCELMLHLLVDDMSDFDVGPVPLRSSSEVSVRGMKIAAWDDDGYFPACRTACRAVQEAARALEAEGAIIEWMKPPRIAEAIELYYSIMGSDGGADAQRLARGSKLDHRVSRMLWMAGLTLPVRWSIVQSLRFGGQNWTASVVNAARPRTASEFWQLCVQLGDLISDFHDEVFGRRGIQAILSPPYALPALPHGAAIDLLPAASYAYYANLLGLPAGVIPWTTIRAEETVEAATARDVAERRWEEALLGAEGLPVGVQIAARPWHDHVVLAVMRQLERAGRGAELPSASHAGRASQPVS
jgi:fatty acid amide hydrolase